MNVGEHFIRELKQINLLQKRLDSVLDDDIPTEQKTTQIIDHIESVNSFAMEFTDNVSSRKIKLTKDFLTTLNHELKTPLVPIRAYSEMLLQGRFGKLNQEQKKRLELLVLSTQQLRNKVESICNDLRNDYNKSESSDEHKIRELEQEKVALEKITTLLDSKVSAESLKIKDLKKKLDKSEHQNKEFEQEKLILSKTLNVEEKKTYSLPKRT
jgi:signal transduction histidine kinase